jgi:hypothetical protein
VDQPAARMSQGRADASRATAITKHRRNELVSKRLTCCGNPRALSRDADNGVRTQHMQLVSKLIE